MSKLDDAADQVLGMAERFRGILELAEVVKSIGSLDQAVAERQAALAAATEAHEKAKATLADADEVIAAMRQQRSDEEKQHSQACDEMRAAAQADADAIRAKAQAEADELIASTQQQLAAAQQAHDDAITAKKAELADLTAQIDKAHDDLGALLVTENNTLARIEDLKAAAKSVLGG